MCKKKQSPTSICEKVKLAIFCFVLKSDQKANHSQMYKKWLCSKNFMFKRYSWKNPSSLSKWSNYSSSIRKMLSKKFCPKNLFAILAKFSSCCCFPQAPFRVTNVPGNASASIIQLHHGFLRCRRWLCYSICIGVVVWSFMFAVELAGAYRGMSLASSGKFV